MADPVEPLYRQPSGVWPPPMRDGGPGTLQRVEHLLVVAIHATNETTRARSVGDALAEVRAIRTAGRET